ncbi:MAG: glycosyltransferase, partial [Chloroflexota bacterium]|nr:glycosyltransferase [Chloroflexota bacterium]
MPGRRLTVLSVAYPLAAVGADAVGGAEQILSRLDAALVSRGHQSVVVAQAGSCVQGRLIPIPAIHGALDDSARRAAQAATRRAIEDALSSLAVDVIHFHALDFDSYLPPPGLPVLATLHLPVDAYSSVVFEIDRPNTFLHCVSRSQHATLPRGEAHVLPPIANGVPLDGPPVSRARANFALALGRICPEKGFHLAASAARAAGLPLVLGGRVFAYGSHEAYFRNVLQPLLAMGWVRFIGPVGAGEKQDLLSRTRCLLIASQAAETSSLVAMEAAARGTPVIAFRAGALPEVVEHGRSGFLVDSVEEMAEAIRGIDRIDPGECRRVAEERFSADAMASRYLARYQELVRSPGIVNQPGLEVAEVTSVAGMEAIRGEWLELWRSGGASVFQHPDWLIPWCRPFNVHEPWLVHVRESGRLVGLAPLLIYTRAGERILTLMGGGVSDDQDVLVRPGFRAAVMRALWEYLAQRGDQWDVCELENLHEDSPLLEPPALPWHSAEPRVAGVRPTITLGEQVTGLAEFASRDLLR